MLKFKLYLLVLAALSSFASTSVGALISLEFNSPVPGTINDQNGLGTGFTHRLLGTGGAIPGNDPNMDLLSQPGSLLLRSTRADINHSQNLSNLEAPGVFVPNVGNQDVFLSVRIRNVTLPNASDQLMIYAGASATQVLRAGVHAGNVFIFSENFGSGDVNMFSGLNAFSTGDDILIELQRVAGNWQLSWSNLTNPLGSGALAAKTLPWLDTADDLYFGVIASNANSNTPFTADIDYFRVETVPEPASIALWAVGILGLGLWRRQRSGRESSG